jgi:tripartite-type tricarboxylate transporter receptor subunit TctC
LAYRNVFIRLIAAAALLALPLAAQSQRYPTKPVRLVVPFAPGGGTDIIARLLAQYLGEAIGQPVVSDNRGGAGSTLGTEIVTKSPPDGYTLLLGNISLAFNAELYKRLSYNAQRDLAPITLVAVQPNILVIHPSLPATTMKEFIALAQANPGKYTYASAGVGSGTHLAGELLKMLTKIDLVHVPYKGTGPALNDLIGGQVQMMVSTFASALPHAKSGRLRALAVTTAKRSSAAPDIPTLIESGVPDFEYSTWYGLFAPAGTRRDIVGKLNAATKQVLSRDDVRQKFESQGVDPLWDTPAELSAYLASETQKWAKVVRATGAKVE